MSLAWFGPISNNGRFIYTPLKKLWSLFTVASEFGISLNQVNWLGNLIVCVYLPTSLIIPKMMSRYGIRRCVGCCLQFGQFHYSRILQCDIGTVCLFISAWVRYAGTARSLSPNSAYALLIVGQVMPEVPIVIIWKITSLYYSFFPRYPKQSTRS